MNVYVSVCSMRRSWAWFSAILALVIVFYITGYFIVRPCMCICDIHNILIESGLPDGCHKLAECMYVLRMYCSYHGRYTTSQGPRRHHWPFGLRVTDTRSHTRCAFYVTVINKHVLFAPCNYYKDTHEHKWTYYTDSERWRQL